MSPPLPPLTTTNVIQETFCETQFKVLPVYNSRERGLNFNEGPEHGGIILEGPIQASSNRNIKSEERGRGGERGKGGGTLD